MRTWLERLADSLDRRTPLALTLLVLLLRPPEADALRVVTWAVAAAPLVVPGLLERAGLWLTLALLVAARVVVDWPLADNHIYLLAYWCLAVGLALRTDSPTETMARSARWLVGLTFLFAVLWKAVLAPEYLDGRFFRVTLLTDDRFTWLATSAGGLTDEQLDANQQALAPAPEGSEILNGPTLTLTPAFERIAAALTWGGVIFEATLAAIFLAPLPARYRVWRVVLLCGFCLLTYALAPVAGFGWLLAVLGLAQCPRDRPYLRLAYIAAFMLIGLFGEADIPGTVLSRGPSAGGV